MKTKKFQKTLKAIQKTLKAISNFTAKTKKNYECMKTQVKKIWLTIFVISFSIITTSCNVTRVITNESQYYTKGDTAVTIQTRTIESYNAKKNY